MAVIRMSIFCDTVYENYDKMKTKITPFILMLALLASCGKDGSPDLPKQGPAPDGTRTVIVPTAILSVDASSMSRALSGPVTGDKFPNGTEDLFAVTAYKGAAAPTTDYSGAYFDNAAVRSDNAGVLSFSAPRYYPPGAEKLYFYAYSPVSAGGYAAGTASAAPTVTWTIDGQQDIMWAKEVTGLGKASAGAQPQPAFTFTHKCKQVRFFVKRDRDFPAGDALTSLKVTGAKTTAVLDLNTGDAVFGGSGEIPVFDGSMTMTETAAQAGDPVMFEPGQTFTVEAAAGGAVFSDVRITLSGDDAGQAGQSCKVTLTFHREEITATATIAEWKDGGEGTTEDNTYPYVLNGNTIVFKDISGEADPTQYPTHEVWTVTPAHAESAWNTNASGLNTYGEKFEVAMKDVEPQLWVYAQAACQNYSQASDDAGTWRLPTVRELVLIYNKIDDLTAVNNTRTGYYWAATEANDSNNAWEVRLDTGSRTNYPKNARNSVRCVRDL
jgi:hypothetical protein